MVVRRHPTGPGLVPPATVVWDLAAHRDGPIRRPRATGPAGMLDTAECFGLIDDLARCGVCEIHIGGAEPTGRADFWDIADRVRAQGLALTVDTDGTGITPAVARRIAGDQRLTARIRLAAPTEAADDAIRGPGAYRAGVRALELLASTGAYDVEVTVPLTRHSADRLDALYSVAGLFGARLRLTGDRPPEAAPDAAQRRALADWLRTHDDVGLGPHPTGDLAEDCGAGAEICLVDATGTVFACPVTRTAPVGTIRGSGGFADLWQNAPLLAHVRAVGCPAAPAVRRPA